MIIHEWEDSVIGTYPLFCRQRCILTYISFTADTLWATHENLEEAGLIQLTNIVFVDRTRFKYLLDIVN